MTEAARRVPGPRLVLWIALGGTVAFRFAIRAIAPTWRFDLIVGDLLTYLGPMALCAGLAGYLALNVATSRSERTFWALIALAVSLVLIAESYWTWYAATVDPAGPPADAWTRILHLAAAVLIFVLVVRSTRLGSLGLLSGAGFLVDVFSLMAIAWPFIFVFGTLPTFRGADRIGVLGAAFTAAYPLVASTMVVPTTLMAFSPRIRFRPVWERMTAMALWLYGVSLLVFPFLYSSAVRADSPGFPVLTVVLGAGFVVLAVALVTRLRTPAGPVDLEPWPTPALTPDQLRNSASAFITVALVGVAYVAYVNDWVTPGSPFFTSIVSCALLLVLRSWLTALERASAQRDVAADPSTGVLSRWLFDRRLRDLVEIAEESGQPLSIAVFDIEGLRRLDAAHAALRDEVAASFASAVESVKAECDEVYRIGGDRFAILVQDTEPEECAALALRVWLAARGEREMPAAVAPAGVCAGIAGYPRHAGDADTLLAAAEIMASVARGAAGEPVLVYDPAFAEEPVEELRMRERARIQRSTVSALAEAVDARDPASRSHSTNVAELATALGKVLGLPDDRVDALELCALMHDVGKIGVRDAILLKPGPLTPEERAVVEEHPVLGERILATARLHGIAAMVRSHHERWDGAGYPDGIAGEAIPIEARILAVCDAFDTVTTGRPYAPAMSIEEALREIADGAGTQFDPKVAATFERMVRRLCAPGVTVAAPARAPA